MIKGNEELYSHISRPIPLLPKKSYDDDKPRSHQKIEEIRQFIFHSQSFPIDPSVSNPPNSIPSEVSEITLPEPDSSSIIYRREANAKFVGPCTLNLNKIIGNAEEHTTLLRMNRMLKNRQSPIKNNNTLIFESRFESGNLDTVIKVSDTEYNLILQNDINTVGNTQWFFFRVTNTIKDLKVKFNIINLGKSGSLYNEGMQVCIYSEEEEKETNKGWTRGGTDISYYPNGLLKNNGKPFYSAVFTYKFTYSKDCVYFAYSYPYTYSELMKYLLSLENDPARNNFFVRRLLCKSIEGNRCDYLTITEGEIPEYMKHRKGVFISARAHPGETVGSWIAQGAIEFLTGSSKEAAILRDRYVFKIIPMLNPDGVINGNYRTNLAGSDLNRKWKTPSIILHPTVYFAKKLAKSLAKERPVELVCDLHGHSRSMGLFMYGCNNFSFPQETRLFPLILSKTCPFFDYKLCSFKMQKSKESTLRISLYKEINVPNIFTMEASFCGNNMVQYTVEDLKEIGKQLCLALLIYSGDSDLGKEISLSKDQILQELKSNKDFQEDCSGNFTDSDSDPSEDNLDIEMIRTLLPSPKKRRSKKLKQGRYSKGSKIEHKSLSTVRKRENFSTRRDLKQISIEKKIEIKKCEECGEIMLGNHICVRKIKSSLSPTPNIKQRKIVKSFSSIGNGLIYVNGKGKTVRDQATQTVYIKRLQNSESNSLYNALAVPSPTRFRVDNGKQGKSDKFFTDLGLGMPIVHNSKLLDPIPSILDVYSKKYNYN